MNDVRLIERWLPIPEIGDGGPGSAGVEPTFVIPAKAGIKPPGNAGVSPASGGCEAIVVCMRAVAASSWFVCGRDARVPRAPASAEAPFPGGAGLYPEAPGERV